MPEEPVTYTESVCQAEWSIGESHSNIVKLMEYKSMLNMTDATVHGYIKMNME